MFFVKNEKGEYICARCGCGGKITKNHFIPKSCGMTVNEEGNYVGICEKCNREKGDDIVLPSWYSFLPRGQQEELRRYLRYARSYVLQKCKDEEVEKYLREMKRE